MRVTLSAATRPPRIVAKAPRDRTEAHVALGDRVRLVVRRARRDGPLDVVFVLFNADGMGGTARSGIEQANALLGLGEGHRVRILSVTRSGASTHYPLADGLEVTYLVDVRPERPVAVTGDLPAELAH